MAAMKSGAGTYNNGELVCKRLYSFYILTFAVRDFLWLFVRCHPLCSTYQILSASRFHYCFGLVYSVQWVRNKDKTSWIWCLCLSQPSYLPLLCFPRTHQLPWWCSLQNQRQVPLPCQSWAACWLLPSRLWLCTHRPAGEFICQTAALLHCLK